MISIELTGRLANQLFEYAVCRSVAESNGYNFYIPSELWLGGDLISCDMGIKDGEITNHYSDLPNQPFRQEIFSIPDFTQLHGFFQSEKYFERDSVKQWFKINTPSRVSTFLQEYPPWKFCFINVRGTDQHIPNLTLPKGYYDKAMELISDFNSSLKFVVITDDIPLAKEYFPTLPIYSNDRDVDFCVLNQGKYVISAISTFCWWACYLQDHNITIAPRGWFAHNLSDTAWSPQDIRTHKFIWI